MESCKSRRFDLTSAADRLQSGDPESSRADSAKGKVKRSVKIRIAILIAFLTLLMIGIYFFDLRAALDEHRLRAWIEEFGAAGPLIYILIFAAAPPLFLPGLPITIAGGIAFGPLWGTVYASIGSTLGAGLAFLVARYLAREPVQALLGERWKRVDEGVTEKGWIYVALTRLIPIFPYTLLNYAFGLTRIGFATYLLTSWLFMLPATAAYVVFSASVFDLLKGNAPHLFWVGLALFLALFAVQHFYRKRKGALPGRPVR